MSNVYIQEPATSGKALLHTTYGDLEVELWCKEAPRACRNFLQLALEGYYDETTFHRVLPGFLVQGGDPTGTGEGGESIWAGTEVPFPVETHSRLSFTRRGLLGMAAVGTAESPRLGSQFFFTLDRATELDREHTLFGKIVGDTVFNLLRIGEVQLEEGSERPVHPPRITAIQVLLNPFEDIVPRDWPAARPRAGATAAKKAAPPPAKTAVLLRNKTLLSFQAEEDESEPADENGAKAASASTTAAPLRMMSSHDILDDPRLSKRQLETDEAAPGPKRTKGAATAAPKATVSAYDQLVSQRQSNRERIAASIAAVQQDMHRTQADTLPAKAVPAEDKIPVDSVSALLRRKPQQGGRKLLQQQLEAYRRKPNVIAGKRAKDPVAEVNTLLTLNAFSEKLHALDTRAAPLDPTRLAKAAAPEPTKVLDICKLHGLVSCLSCRDTFGLNAEEGGRAEEGWLMHRLVFDKEEGYREIREELTNLVVIDAREKSKRLQKNV